ncbi:Snf7-domain-containing protein [Gigaspora rosea]|uniref:Snf7-domain-containing protein n=1 Tax=Gigaspora rosea TaxID=44941 RepID=A0A397ULN4_9GLOM|nr:Snf7-domain-containing protein [Gigaspora rosea]
MGNKTSKITSQDRAILDLKIQRDKLIQYQKKLQVISDKETEIAKQALRNGNKRGALLALKKKKYQEQLLKKTDSQLLNLEELTQSIEFALVEKDVLSGLELGNNILKEIHKEMTIEKVEKLMEDTADAIAYQNEIEELLSGKITREDEDEILEELRQIEEEQLEFPRIPTTPLNIADVEIQSTSQQKAKSETVQKETKKLEVTLI